MMPISDEIRGQVLHRVPSHDIRKVATRQGMSSLREDGWRFVREGRTTVEEVMRNTKDEAAGGAFDTQENKEAQAAKAEAH
jgi:type II secretory ATPase GspE/PulE/Tfp pilus assembly ATPase PilB-like protein